MDISTLKKEIKARGWTYAKLADELKISVGSLKGIMCGARPLTKQLAAHIQLLLEGHKEAMLVYHIDLTDSEVLELCGRHILNEEERAQAVEAVLRHNLMELAELGKQFDWTPEERKALGI